MFAVFICEYHENFPTAKLTTTSVGNCAPSWLWWLHVSSQPPCEWP